MKHYLTDNTFDYGGLYTLKPNSFLYRNVEFIPFPFQAVSLNKPEHIVLLSYYETKYKILYKNKVYWISDYNLAEKVTQL